MADRSSESEDSWTLVDKNQHESGEDSCGSSEFVKVEGLSARYHHKLVDRSHDDDDTVADLSQSDQPECASHRINPEEAVSSDVVETEQVESGGHQIDPVNDEVSEVDQAGRDLHQMDHQEVTSSDVVDDGQQESSDGVEVLGTMETAEAEGDLRQGEENESLECDMEGGACGAAGGAIPKTSPQKTSMFLHLGEGREDSVDSDDSDRFSADFLGRSGLELRRQASSSDSDSDFVRIDPRHLNDLTSSGASSISPQFQFMNRRDEGDIDDRCESDISLVDDTEDLSSVSNAADIPIHNVPVIRNYRQKPNNNLNFCLSVLAACVLCMAIGLGVGHAIGSAREASLQSEVRQGQQERLRVLQDDLLMCLQKQEEMDTTIVKLTEIERLLKDADYWREEYEELLRVKLKNEEKWRQEKEVLSSSALAKSRVTQAPGYSPAYYSRISEKRQLLNIIKGKERDILNLRLKLDMQKAITNEHIALERQLQVDADQREDTKHHLQSEVTILKVEKENLEERLMAEDEDDAKMESTIDTLRHENDDLKRKLTLEEQDFHQLETKVATLQAELTQENLDDLDLESQVTTLKQEIGTLRQTIEEMAQGTEMEEPQLDERERSGLGPRLAIGQCHQSEDEGELEHHGKSKYTSIPQESETTNSRPDLGVPSEEQLPPSNDDQNHKDSVDDGHRKHRTILVTDLKRHKRNAQTYMLLFKQANLELVKCRRLRDDGENMEPSFSTCMSTLFNCTNCGDMKTVHTSLLYMLNVTMNSEFMEYLRRKQTDYASSAQFQELRRHFEAAYRQAENAFQSGWRKFQKASNSKEFKDSKTKAEDTVKNYWKKWKSSDAYSNMLKAYEETSTVLTDASRKVSKRVQKTYDNIKAYSAPVVEEIYNSTRDAVMSFDVPKQTWKKIEEISKHVPDSKDVYNKLKDNLSQGWNHVKESCDKYTKTHTRHTRKEYKHENKKHHDDDRDDDDDDDDDDKDKKDDSKNEKTFKEKFKVFVKLMMGLDGGKFEKMNRRERKTVYEKLDDLEDDHKESVEKLGKLSWLQCQLGWWKQAFRRNNVKVSGACSKQLMNWQTAAPDMSRGEQLKKRQQGADKKVMYGSTKRRGHEGSKVVSEGGEVKGHKAAETSANHTEMSVKKDASPQWYFHRYEDRENRRHDSRWYFRSHKRGNQQYNSRKVHNMAWMERRARERARERAHDHKMDWQFDRARERAHHRRHSTKW